MKVTNNSKAPQGVQTLRGVAFIKPGETRDLDLNEVQAKLAARLKFLEITGTPSEASFADISLAALEIPPNEVDQLRQQVEAKDAEIKRLTDLVAERDAEIEKLGEAVASSGDSRGPSGPFEVRETSPGWYAAFDLTGEQVGNKMRSDDAEAFKAMSQAEQEQLLAK